jgi:PAS domain S-box-containing protein
MVVTDPTLPHNPIVYANPSFLELCGYDEAEILGQNYFFLTGERTDEEVEAQIRAAMKGEEALNLEVMLYKKSGQEIWVAQFVSPVRDADGNVIQHFASFLDITRRVRSERRAMRLSEIMEQRVVERTKQLTEGQEVLRREVEHRRQIEAVLTQSVQEKDALLKERELLLSEVNHRAKNSITMAIALLRLQGRRGHEGDVALALEKAVQRLMHFSRIHEMLYRQTGDFQTVDMGDYLAGLCAEFQGVQAAHEGKVEISLDADPVRLDVDRAINVALISGEAITNALKHAFPPGQGGRVQIDFRRKGTRLQIVVQDNGVGLPGEMREGSLGMRLMQGMVGTLQGELAIEGRGGTRVVVTFPLQRPEGDGEDT